jgi:hypothetical protein
MVRDKYVMEKRGNIHIKGKVCLSSRHCESIFVGMCGCVDPFVHRLLLSDPSEVPASCLSLNGAPIVLFLAR